MPARSFLAILLSQLLTHSAFAFWKPAAGTSWEITLSQPPSSSTPNNIITLDFDLFDNPASTIANLHAESRYAICYFSAGSYENWRPDASQFQPSDLGNPLDGWPGERWLNTKSTNVRHIMEQRMDLAKSKGCDAIDPDNVDAYDNDNGLGLTQDDAVDYVNFLADQGHQRGMAVGLKNAGDIIDQVLGNIQFQVNEQCVQYQECDTSQPFINANKPVFNIEYRDGTPSASTVNSICNDPTRQGFSTLIKHMNLDNFYIACPGMKYLGNSTSAGNMTGVASATMSSSTSSNAAASSGSASAPGSSDNDNTGSATWIPPAFLNISIFLLISIVTYWAL